MAGCHGCLSGVMRRNVPMWIITFQCCHVYHCLWAVRRYERIHSSSFFFFFFLHEDGVSLMSGCKTAEHWPPKTKRGGWGGSVTCWQTYIYYTSIYTGHVWLRSYGECYISEQFFFSIAPTTTCHWQQLERWKRLAEGETGGHAFYSTVYM